ncbi:MAG: nucleotide sugar dehydrogenase [Flavobacteriaceae bacterium]|nr:nucleotide sugar dehydrogenase [Flavobacteriaceae bacterium]
MKNKIAVIGLGYVGLPLAAAFSEKYAVLGYDNDSKRVRELNSGLDRIEQLAKTDLLQLKHRLIFSEDPKSLSDYNTYIITVPTPVTAAKKPDLSFLLEASKTVGHFLKKGDTVIYESTVYPGCTEEDCVPVLERASGLKFNTDFFCGYSPERINPGDKVNTLTQIKKVTSGSTLEVAEQVDALYRDIIKAGTHKAPSIKVAEAAKAIENAQRDLNISFVNELALIFDRMQIDTHDVLEAAATKWNFLPFKPGLVGGHCISVDPYFLTHKAIELGYTPEVILSGRNVNDSIPQFVAAKVVDLMRQKGIYKKGAKALILGITFKEIFNDIRYSKVPEIYKALKTEGLEVEVFDPVADPESVNKEYGISLTKAPSKYEAVILAVAHKVFLENGVGKYKNPNGAVLYDIKSTLDREVIDGRL